MLPDAAQKYDEAERRRTAATLALTRRAWAGMGPDFDASWQSVGQRVEVVAMSAQLGAARAAEPYLGQVLAELGIPDNATGEVAPAAFVGAAGDGRPVATLIYGGVTTAKQASAAGAPAPVALDQGGRWLDMAVQTLIADTARAAVSVGITARPVVTGYVRMLQPPSCSRCAILAGRVYRWSTGFQRHPRCDCRMVPSTKDIESDLTTDPKAYFESLSTREQDRIFTNAGARAIRDGADMGRVVNARRGMEKAASGRLQRREVNGQMVYTTTTGPQPRPPARRLSGGRYVSQRTPRLMPESIYELATDREDAIRLLRLHRYLAD